MVMYGYSFTVHAWLPLCVAIWISILKKPDAPSRHWKENRRFVITRLYQMLLWHFKYMINHGLCAFVRCCGYDDDYDKCLQSFHIPSTYVTCAEQISEQKNTWLFSGYLLLKGSGCLSWQIWYIYLYFRKKAGTLNLLWTKQMIPWKILC